MEDDLEGHALHRALKVNRFVRAELAHRRPRALAA
jgi:hypothetical protein